MCCHWRILDKHAVIIAANDYALLQPMNQFILAAEFAVLLLANIIIGTAVGPAHLFAQES
jgi:hypothetical protein